MSRPSNQKTRKPDRKTNDNGNSGVAENNSGNASPKELYDKAQQEIRTLSNPDSLERYAREHYYMHTPDEDIYLVEE